MKKSVICLAIISMVILFGVFCYAEAARENPAAFTVALHEQDLVGIGALAESFDKDVPASILLMKKIETCCVADLFITNNTSQNLEVRLLSVCADGVNASYYPSNIKLQAGEREVISLEFDKAPEQGSTLTCTLDAVRSEGSASICYSIPVNITQEAACAADQVTNGLGHKKL